MVATVWVFARANAGRVTNNDLNIAKMRGNSAGQYSGLLTDEICFTRVRLIVRVAVVAALLGPRSVAILFVERRKERVVHPQEHDEIDYWR